MAEQKQLRILCFGDSLTAGYHNWGLGEHSYAGKMKEAINTAFPEIEIHTQIDGLPGDLVVPPGHFLGRIQADCKDAQWDWIIFLGGTNDLGYDKEPDDIYRGLQDSWNIALSSGAKVLALTIPEAAARSKILIERRTKLNNLILSHEVERFHSFDLHEKIPHMYATPEFIREMFDDGLHLTPAGYDLMGSVIGEHMVNLLRTE